MIDLHIHSTYSDGTKTIETIIEQAKELQLSQIAITDHNILEGSFKAHQLAPDLSIIGAELSVGYLDNRELHLLCYFPNGSPTDYKNVGFVIKMSEARKRLATAETVENLNEEGYEIELKELTEFAKGAINRVHICRVLMKHGYISSVQEGFEKLVGDHCPAYVPREYVTIEETVQAVHDDGGIAILAHPYNYKNVKDIPKLLDDVKEIVDGIECFHPSANKEDSDYLSSFAKEHGLRITGGSDYHGENKPTIALNMMEVSDIYTIR